MEPIDGREKGEGKLVHPCLIPNCLDSELCNDPIHLCEGPFADRGDRGVAGVNHGTADGVFVDRNR